MGKAHIMYHQVGRLTFALHNSCMYSTTYHFWPFCLKRRQWSVSVESRAAVLHIFIYNSHQQSPTFDLQKIWA